MALGDFRFVILAEDTPQQEFVYRWLLERGAERRKVTKVPLPAGTQAGEQHVREKLPREVQEQRRKVGQNVALVVAVDADRLSVADRLNGLNIQPPRAANERIVVLIPKRNVETWFHHLAGNTVDEETDYKHTYRNENRPWVPAAVSLQAWLTGHPNVGSPPPSLLAARPEFARLP